jgi:predicted transcriptional regulator
MRVRVNDCRLTSRAAARLLDVDQRDSLDDLVLFVPRFKLLSNSDRFLKAFVAIEKHLRNEAGAARGATFYQLVELTAKSSPEVRRFQNDLKEFADLRNAIVHERGDGHVIAEPNDRACDEVEHIAALLTTPPSVYPLFRKHVFACGASDSLGQAVKLMLEKSFSQLPITAHGRTVALLTASTISRWLGACAEDEIFSLTETRIEEVLKHTEDRENHSFARQSATLFEAGEALQDFESRGKRLEAILITHSGKASEALLGIITVSDLPKVLARLGV